MRQLLEEKMNELVSFINSLMRDSTINPFRYVSATSTRILSGEEEGVFEWITVNYLLGSFAGHAASLSHFLMAGALLSSLFSQSSFCSESRSLHLCVFVGNVSAVCLHGMA